MGVLTNGERDFDPHAPTPNVTNVTFSYLEICSINSSELREKCHRDSL